MARKHVRAVFFGPQGSGKSTQAKLLAERFGVVCLGSGECLRQEVQEGTALGQLVMRYVEHGMLAPDDIINAILHKRLAPVIETSKGFFIDGSPRNVEQAEELNKYAKINLAVHFKLSDAVAESRVLGRLFCLSCGAIYHEAYVPLVKEGVCSVCSGPIQRREDDGDDGSVRDRLLAYHFMTEPLVTYYRERGVLLAVNADQPIQSLFEELVKKMAKLGFTVKS